MAALDVLRYIDKAEARRLVTVADIRPSYAATLPSGPDRIGRVDGHFLGAMTYANVIASWGVGFKQVPGDYWSLTVTDDGFPCAEVCCQCGESPAVEVYAPFVDCACERVFYFDGADVWAFNPKTKAPTEQAETSVPT